MANLDADTPSSSTGRDHGIGEEDQGPSVDMLGLVSLVLSGLGFLTLLKLADRRDRSPARALGLFVAHRARQSAER
jgi:hypothetical protein